MDALSTPGDMGEVVKVNHQLIADLNEKLRQTKMFRSMIIHHMKGVNLDEVGRIVKDALLELVPVRSGRLLDTILNTLQIEMTFSDYDNIFFDLTYTHAAKRPDPLWGRVKHGVQASGVREFGLGGEYIPTHAIKNVKRVAAMPTAETTFKTYGNPENVVLYELDDPLARTEIFETVTKMYIAAFVSLFDELLHNMPVKFADIKIGKISGAIATDTAMQKYIKSRLD